MKRWFIGKPVVYVLLSILVVAGYFLLLAGASLMVGNSLEQPNPVTIGLVAFLLAIGLDPARKSIQKVVDRVFYRGQIDYGEALKAFGRDLSQSTETRKISGLLRRYVNQALVPSRLHLFIYDSASGEYATALDEESHPTSDVRFSGNSALVQLLSKHQEALVFTGMAVLPATLRGDEEARMALLDATVYVPLTGSIRLIGWLALGKRLSGMLYSGRDRDFLESLCNQAALALERSQNMARIDRVLREMDAMVRVAQGVSFTIPLDDILELIYAQINQVIPTRDLRVTLRSSVGSNYYHAFFLEDDERMPGQENQPLAINDGLEEEVISNQRILVTNDYERECRKRGLLTTTRGIYAWIGVPLNAGATTIGSISMGNRDSMAVYTSEQQKLLQTIADQAAGAIVKTRLLEETKNHALQLTKLNEIGISLTANLELRPLLDQILQSACSILSCEAGILFLADPQTDELVFEVLTGPIAKNLQGQRLPVGTGIVGMVVQGGKPFIANDVEHRNEWFDQIEVETGFEIRDFLIVPMRYQDRAIGAIEVINKQSGEVFSNADQELLIAFTSQATIAIENARLYTMTDQALAARVDELSVMQRIDRELNANLEIEHTLRLTLDWAMRRSNAEAGLIGLVEERGLRVVISQGFGDALDEYLSSQDGQYPFLSIESPGIREIIEIEQPLKLKLPDKSGKERFSIMPEARLQIVVPIRRETSAIGVIILENSQSGLLNKTEKRVSNTDDPVGFLARLSDHAAIAITNAMLFEEVRRANLEKSRIMSFVAHELKNPMTSIKGYTELVSGGTAGPINEIQFGFLATVRSNVERMDTIVSDLNDLTKIEADTLCLEYQSVRIDRVLDDVVHSMKRQIDERKQKLSISLKDEISPLWTDPFRLSQILINLVSNSNKYTPKGGDITIGIEQQAGREASPTGSNSVLIWVRDTGIGIKEGERKMVFQQYFRSDSAKEMASGIGLGLAITRRLVEMQGGQIWFESEPGKGSTFYVSLPISEMHGQ